MHCPVVSTEFGELACAVERIDDPHPLRAQPDGIVGAFLGQHGVLGPLRCQRLHQEVVRPLVPRRLPFGRTGVGELLADAEEQLPSLGREPGSDLVVAAFGH